MSSTTFTRRHVNASVYSALLVISARDRFGSRSDLFFSGLTTFIRIFIFAAMYRVAFGSSSSSGFVASIWAVAIAQAIFSLDRPDPTLSIGDDIKEGAISSYLLRPMNYVHYVAVNFIGRSIPALITNMFFCSCAALILTRTFPESFFHMFLCSAVFVVGVILVTMIATVLGLLGFWTQDTSAFNWISHKFYLLFGGLIIPLSLLPHTIEKVVSFTPWSAGLARPGQLFSQFTYGQWVETLGVQIVWLVLLYWVSSALTARGISKLNVSGG